MPRKTRCYIPGHTHKVTRSTIEHTFFLAPIPGCREVFGYVLAHAANTYGIEIHSAIAMSSHYHITATDPLGNFGLFLSLLNSLLTRILNVRLGRRDTLWGCGRPSIQRIVRPIDHIAQVPYVTCNAVEARLVATAAEWPGFIITPDQIGTTLTFERPDEKFFETRKGRGMPKTIELKIHEPKDATDQWGPGVFAQRVAEAVAHHEAAANVGVAGVSELTVDTDGCPDLVKRQVVGVEHICMQRARHREVAADAESVTEGSLRDVACANRLVPT